MSNDDEIKEDNIIKIDGPKPEANVDFEQMASELRQLMELMRASTEQEFEPDDEEVVENVIDLFTKAKIKTEEKVKELEKIREVQKLLFDLEDLKPTDVVIIGLVPVPGQPEHMKRLITMSTLKTVQEVNHLIDSAKSRLL